MQLGPLKNVSMTFYAVWHIRIQGDSTVAIDETRDGKHSQGIPSHKPD